MKHKAVIEFGPPCAGKGTAGRDLEGFVYIATGDLVREELKRDTEMSRRLKTIQYGKFADDDDIVNLFKQKLESEKSMKKYIPGEHYLLLDGTPRTMGQVLKLSPILDIAAICLFTNISREELRRRNRERFIEKGRIDDSPDAFERRLIEYETITLPVLKVYSDSVPIIEINASLPKKEVRDQLYVATRPFLRQAMQAETKKYAAQ